MMPSDYINASGAVVEFDLDAVVDVAASYSGRRKSWTATLIYIPATKAFVELRSSPPDFRGNSADEAEEVDHAYIQQHFTISEEELESIRRHPTRWRFIDRRSPAGTL